MQIDCIAPDWKVPDYLGFSEPLRLTSSLWLDVFLVQINIQTFFLLIFFRFDYIKVVYDLFSQQQPGYVSCFHTCKVRIYHFSPPTFSADPGKVICAVVVLATSWIGLLVYYLYAKNHITEWFK